MKLRSDAMTRLARSLPLAAVALVGGALSMNLASAQQEQSGRSDRSSTRDSSGQYQSDRSRDTSGQNDQRQRADSSQFSDRSTQDRSQRQTSDRSASSDQYRNQQSDQYRGQQPNSSRNQPRDQGGRGGQQEDVAWLGVFLSENDQNQGNQGAMITQVYPAGPAARAGLRPGDVITAVDGQRVSGQSELISAIEQHQPGARAQLTITRNNQQVNLPLTLGSRDSFMWRGQSEDQWSGQYGGGQYASQGGQSQWSNQGGQWTNQGGQWSTQSGGQHDHFSNLPPFAMQLEHERRLYEQNQRIETQIAQLQNEIRQLREAIQQQQRR
jgi:hypothetical protein